MCYTIEKITTENYHLFDDMISWRLKGQERSVSKKTISKNKTHDTEILSNQNLNIYAVQTDDKFVGWISLVYIPKIGKPNCNGHIFVDELWVQPTYRQMGMAKALMKKGDELKESMAVVGVRLYVSQENPAAIKLYENSGFRNEGPTYFMEK